MAQKITTYIPYGANENLAQAYNDCLESCQSEYALLLDHDLFMANPKWHSMCLDAIDELWGRYAPAIISCVTNRIGPVSQKVNIDFGDNDSVENHISIARTIQNDRGLGLKEVKPPLSGFFFLVNKYIWGKLGGFRDVGRGVLGTDWDYSERAYSAGKKLYIINGLYVYHRMGMRKLKW